MQLGKINNRYELMLPDFRCAFHAERPWWEKGRLESCAELMTPGMTVVDVGAEHGDFTALYRQWVGPEGDVIPVEPCAHYWPFIRQTWEANFRDGPSKCFEGFAAATSDSLCLIERHWPQVAFGVGIPDGGFLHLAHAPQVPQITLDDLLEDVPVGGIVIDVEGAEYDVLTGAVETMATKHPYFWVSVHEETMWNWYRRTLKEIHSLMEGLDYVGEELPHHGEAEAFWLYSPKTERAREEVDLTDTGEIRAITEASLPDNYRHAPWGYAGEWPSEP